MIAVALLRIGSGFEISISTVTWLISTYFLAAAIGQPLMGRLADLFGPRRIFVIGLALVGISSLLSPWVPSFGWLLALRVVQALGASAAYPAGLSIIRSMDQTLNDGQVKASASALGIISICSNVTAALGPVLGGFLVAMAGWQAIFWVNVPIVLMALIIALKWLPADQLNSSEDNRKGKGMLHLIDLPGIVLFSGLLTSLMFFLLSLSDSPQWGWLIAVPIVGALLIYRELHTDKPFINVRMLASNRRMVSVFAQFACLNIVFYSLFFSLPMWLEQVRGYEPQYSGLLMLPFAGIGILTTPLAVRIIKKSGHRQSIVIGNIVLVLGTLLLLLLEPGSPVAFILIVAAVIGIPNGFNNMGLQTALYSNTKPEHTGAAFGLFQTFRSLGSILSTSLLGLVFSGTVTTAGLHTIALIAAVISVALLAVSLSRRLT